MFSHASYCREPDVEGSWTQWSPEVPASPYNSVILWRARPHLPILLSTRCSTGHSEEECIEYQRVWLIGIIFFVNVTSRSRAGECYEVYERPSHIINFSWRLTKKTDIMFSWSFAPTTQLSHCTSSVLQKKHHHCSLLMASAQGSAHRTCTLPGLHY